MTLYLDVETRSRVDIKACGAHVYAKNPSTDVLCAVIADENTMWSLRMPALSLPPHLEARIRDGERIVAHNASFEATIVENVLSPRYGWPNVPTSQWDCTMARCAAMALPLNLDAACKALDLAYQKDMRGRRVMLKMAKPKKDGTFHEDITSLLHLCEYCEADVAATRALDRAVRPLSPSEREVWEVDFWSNSRGVAIDRTFVTAAIARANAVTADLNDRMATITAGVVPNVTAAAKLRDFAKSKGVVFPTVVKRAGEPDAYETEQADKAAIEELLKDVDLDPTVREAFDIRILGAKSSVAKLQRMLAYSSVDGRSRGNVCYHGSATGRWSGRAWQPQNLPRIPSGFDWDSAYDGLATANLPQISRMLRGAIVAEPGRKLIGGDYSSVEARCVVWMAKQHDVVEWFAQDKDVYVQMAALIFGIAPEDVTPEQRFIGKTSVLGCGYGIGWKKFQLQCGRMGKPVSDELAQRAVGGWREINHKVASSEHGIWKTIEKAAKEAILHPGHVAHVGSCAFRMAGGSLLLRLPNGRLLHFNGCRMEDGKFGKVIGYMGISPWTKQWSLQTTWGGALYNNICQGACRDFTAQALVNMYKKGGSPILTVHDELLCEVPLDFPLAILERTMVEVPSWAAGFPLAAKCWEGPRYVKE